MLSVSSIVLKNCYNVIVDQSNKELLTKFDHPNLTKFSINLDGLGYPVESLVR